jgi:hypothetical protein
VDNRAQTIQAPANPSNAGTKHLVVILPHNP